MIAGPRLSSRWPVALVCSAAFAAFARAAARQPARTRSGRPSPSSRSGHRARPVPRLSRRGPGRSARRQARRLGRHPRRPAATAPRRAAATGPDGAVRRRADAAARRAGAGLVLDGSLVRSAAGVELSATLRRSLKRGRAVRAGGSGASTRCRRWWTGSPPSSSPGGPGELTTLGELSTTRAITEYLQGKTAMRQGRYGEAKAHYTAALREDSTFALAAVELLAVANRPQDQEAVARGERLAWAYRDKLTPVGRLLLTAWLGPKYPAPSSTIAQIAAWQAAVAAEPDLPEAWFELGDRQLHDGRHQRLAPSGRAGQDQLPPRARAGPLVGAAARPSDPARQALPRRHRRSPRPRHPLAGAGHHPGRPLALRALALGDRPGRFRRGRARPPRGSTAGATTSCSGWRAWARPRGWVWPTSSARSARSSAVRWPGPSYGTRGFAGEIGCSIPAAPRAAAR